MDESPILFIDDDEDDQHLFNQAVTSLRLSHPVISFTNAQAALDYLSSTTQSPFLIISEIVLPGLNGLELRQQIERDAVLRKKAIPFIFLTSPVVDHLIDQAYELPVQGVFEKQDNLPAWQGQLQRIVDYWTDCYHPKRFGQKKG